MLVNGTDGRIPVAWRAGWEPLAVIHRLFMASLLFAGLGSFLR